MVTHCSRSPWAAGVLRPTRPTAGAYFLALSRPQHDLGLLNWLCSSRNSSIRNAAGPCRPGCTWRSGKATYNCDESTTGTEAPAGGGPDAHADEDAHADGVAPVKQAPASAATSDDDHAH
ncbi:hypothetical protein Krad_4579 (plasmid) [Kineococcus radiotolerans SRS30216 = ATCC BAA-149]|uniref:Uncharacterized protein n=1 Tax=Kineococcus radiotolerans (strain ATCC BAA-149 / DSM 14245 / SRS30216) TaxID=266940 RepID=A6WGU9_KINRD|nr:hypothetical protein Krad_4579 [Kineococcus radiotolerans SRS30216 = ATCC BAA-149]